MEVVAIMRTSYFCFAFCAGMFVACASTSGGTARAPHSRVTTTESSDHAASDTFEASADPSETSEAEELPLEDRTPPREDGAVSN